jgi:Uma2 family endonuclease
VEVVSGNWQNDYAQKVDEYAILGISEYWIVDYAALGGLEFIGRSKQATITVLLYYCLHFGRRWLLRKAAVTR